MAVSAAPIAYRPIQPRLPGGSSPFQATLKLAPARTLLGVALTVIALAAAVRAASPPAAAVAEAIGCAVDDCTGVGVAVDVRVGCCWAKAGRTPATPPSGASPASIISTISAATCAPTTARTPRYMPSPAYLAELPPTPARQQCGPLLYTPALHTPVGDSSRAWPHQQADSPAGSRFCPRRPPAAAARRCAAC